MATLDGLDLSAPISFIDSCADPYPALCAVIASLLDAVKIPLDDKQGILADVSDILDKIQPSSRSGFSVKRKVSSGPKRKG
jgi:hypothetical protein